jgi:hypothetical protein
MFPTVTGTTLAGNRRTIPDDLGGQIVLVVIAFDRRAQAMIDSWLDPLSRRMPPERELAVIEVPMIDSPFWRTLGRMIDAGMRSGIPPDRHDYVMTYYGNADAFRRILAMDDRTLAYLYLLDREGRIRWEARGSATAAGLEALVRAIEELRKERPVLPCPAP